MTLPSLNLPINQSKHSYENKKDDETTHTTQEQHPTCWSSLNCLQKIGAIACGLLIFSSVSFVVAMTCICNYSLVSKTSTLGSLCSNHNHTTQLNLTFSKSLYQNPLPSLNNKTVVLLNKTYR